MPELKSLNNTNALRVYTDSGEYFGDIEESILAANKVFGWKIKASKASFLNKILSGAKGVIVPHKFVRSIGDIMIIDRSAIPSSRDDETGDDNRL